MLLDSISAAMLLAADDTPFFLSLLANITVWAKVALGIGFVIFVHELGHFAAAKTFGVKCEKFYVGFDPPIRIGPIKFPRTFGKFTYGETEYGIGIIPLGGYVKMLGQDDDPRKLEEENARIRLETGEEDAEGKLDPRSYPAKPVWQRMIIISSGVVMNVITGIIFAAIAYGFGVSYTPAIVGAVTPGGPAWQAGIEPGGKVVAVADYQAPEMHFREMRGEIFNAGLENPSEPVRMSILYDDGAREFALPTEQRPDEAIIRMVGISPPFSVKLSDTFHAAPDSVAASVLSAQDAGATLVAFDGIPINNDSIVPATPYLDHLYSNPTKPISLTLRRTDGTEQTVVLPPQRANTIGIRYAIGPVASLVAGGPAEQAGMQVGDQILRVGDNPTPDAFGLASQLVSVVDSVSISVRREDQELELSITPSNALQTLPPTEGISGEIAINALGFAFEPLTTIAGVSNAAVTVADSEPLQVGDTIKEVRLLADEDADLLTDPRLQLVRKELLKGWTFSALTPLRNLREVIHLLPVGTRLEVLATRPPDDRVVTSVVEVVADEEYMFERGVNLSPTEAIQRADSLTGAVALGLHEGQRRFQEVVRFLRNIPKIRLRHVGGPLAIVGMAKGEAERGLSPLLMFLTFLSMNLAILNFLPIPALDGGHMVFLLYELIFGKRANEQLEFKLTVAGLLTLLTLMVVVFANDIMRATM
jgi:regulator of sigma E protease